MATTTTYNQMSTAWALVGFMGDMRVRTTLDRRGVLTMDRFRIAGNAMRVVQGMHLSPAEHKEIGALVVLICKNFS